MITIELTDLVITKMEIDYERQVVIVWYNRVDDDGKVWDSGTAFFWVTIPQTATEIDDMGQVITYAPIPENYFQLPESYIPTLLALRNDADTALTAKFLV